MLPLSYTRKYQIFNNTTYSIHKDTCYCITGPTRPTFINSSATHYTILVGRHFTLKINDDFLPCFLYKSFFYGRKVRKEKVERRGYFKILFDKRMKNQWLKIPVPCFFWSGAQEVCCFYIYQKNSAMTLLWQKLSGNAGLCAAWSPQLNTD